MLVARGCRSRLFPVPANGDYMETDTEAGLVRAADLIGQLANPFYPRKHILDRQQPAQEPTSHPARTEPVGARISAAVAGLCEPAWVVHTD
jgi:hypothetical protein